MQRGSDILKTGKRIQYFKNLLLAAAILFYSCEYSPSETNYHDIKLGEPNVVFTVLEEDKLNILRGEITISYERILNEHKLIGFKLFINQYEHGWGYAGSNAISFDSRAYNDGYYSLKLELIVSTNSGSLADRTGAEVFIISKIYNVYFFNNDVNVPNITEAAPENGSLKIKWEQYTQRGFGKYILNKNGNKITEISDISQNYFYDKTYAGEKAVYRIDMDILGSVFIGYGKEKEIDLPAVHAVYSEVVNDFSLKISWERTPFDSAFKSYIIGKGCGEEIIINDIDSTTLLDENPAFNGGIIYVNVESKTGGHSNFPPYYYAEKIGKPFNYYHGYRFESIPNQDCFIIYNGTSIVKYNSETTEIIDSVVVLSEDVQSEFGLDVSSDGTYLFCISKRRGEIKKYNLQTLQEIETFSVINLIPYGHMLNSLAVSDNNLMAIFSGGMSWKTLSVINTSTKKRLTTCPASGAMNDISFTKDGKYIIHSNYIYKFENNAITNKGLVEDGTAPCFLDENRFACYQRGYLNIYSNEELGLLKQITVAPYYNAAGLIIDQFTGYAG
ncbi:MAG: YncE family protein, partial [Ignavibacteria bacterium]